MPQSERDRQHANHLRGDLDQRTCGGPLSLVVRVSFYSPQELYLALTILILP
jgi:hypothetical protein